ncbi:MAG: SDR family oxidoreductase [Chloroflexi bacterium]|nr:SDR family oxidoreductase [Chloroflexota bacterium]
MATRRLEGQGAIVTGGATGIGGATARRLAEDGANVLIPDVDLEGAQEQVARIRAAGGTAEAMRADTGIHADVKAMVERAAELWGEVRIVVNNAYSGPISGSAEEVEEEGWDRGLDVMVKSMYLAARYAVPLMRKAGGGSIVNLASVHGLLMAPRSLVYETAKSAVIGLTKQMACDFGPDGIRVNAICPGHIVTERIQEQWDEHPDGLRYFAQQYPLRRTGKPADIANAIAFLCSDDASFITGHALVVDGGLTIQLQENLGVNLGHYLKEQPDTWYPY